DGYKHKEQRKPSTRELTKQFCKRLVLQGFEELGVTGMSSMLPGSRRFSRTVRTVMDALKELATIEHEDKAALEARRRSGKDDKTLLARFMRRMDALQRADAAKKKVIPAV